MACERCASFAWDRRYMQPVVIGGCRHHPSCPCVRDAEAALAPVRRTAAGMGLASLAGADGQPRTLRMVAGDSIAEVRVTPGPTSVRLELAAEGWRGGQGWARGVVEVDRPTFDRALERAEQAGGLPRLADMLARRGLAAAISVDTSRPILGRGED